MVTYPSVRSCLASYKDNNQTAISTNHGTQIDLAKCRTGQATFSVIFSHLADNGHQTGAALIVIYKFLPNISKDVRIRTSSDVISRDHDYLTLPFALKENLSSFSPASINQSDIILC